LGAAVTKVEPPGGDPFERYAPAWYARLHEGLQMRRLDLKQPEGRDALEAILASSDLLVTAQRRSALARLGLAPIELTARHPRLCHVAITGHAPPDDDIAGHDLTYMAVHGLVAPGALPPTLFADMAGSERVVSAALALVVSRQVTGKGASMTVALADAAAALAEPRDERLTLPGALLGGALPGYNLYETRLGWIAVAALEPHFAENLARELSLPELTHAALRERFTARTADEWETWARDKDLPIVALR
jgi:alpha-methylacyl-CoA racemase